MNVVGEVESNEGAVVSYKCMELVVVERTMEEVGVNLVVAVVGSAHNMAV